MPGYAKKFSWMSFGIMKLRQIKEAKSLRKRRKLIFVSPIFNIITSVIIAIIIILPTITSITFLMLYCIVYRYLYSASHGAHVG